MRIALALVALVVALPVSAQSFVLLELPHSPDAIGLADAVVAAPTADAQGFLSNPAFLGHDARTSHVRLSGAPESDWLSAASSDRASFAASVGMDGRRFGVPLALGLGVVRSTFDFGTFVFRDDEDRILATTRPRQDFTALSVGLGYHGPVSASVGVGVRWTEEDTGFFAGGSADPQPSGSDPIPTDFEEPEPVILAATTLDVGALVEVPVARLAGWRAPDAAAGFDLDLRLGYARTSSGSGHYENALSAPSPYVDFVFFELTPPTTIRLGWSATAGYDAAVGRGHLRAVALTLAVQADQDVSRLDGHDGFGTIRLVDALTGQGDDDLGGDEGCPRPGYCIATPVNPYVGRRGVQLSLAEVLSISYGRFEGGGFNMRGEGSSTYGLGFSLGGLLRAGALLQGNPRAYRLGERVDLRVTRSVYFANDDEDGSSRRTVFWGTTLSARLP